MQESHQKGYWQIERKTSDYNKYMKWRIRFYRADLSLLASHYTKTRNEAEELVIDRIDQGQRGFPIGRHVSFTEYQHLNVFIRDSDKGFIDRFTVWIDTAVFGMSADPFWPQGFNQYAGDTATDGYFEPMSKGAEKLGELIDISDVPEDVRKAILQRME